MKKILLIAVLLCLVGSSQFHERDSVDEIETIVFMRHGEKPFLDFGQLNCQGFNRALALPKILMAKFGKPDYIFAPNPYWGGFYYYIRALVTIEPTAIQFEKSVNTEFPYFLIYQTAKALLWPEYHSSVIFVAWEHISIEYIVKTMMALLGDEYQLIPPWPCHDYDSLYVVTINWSHMPPKVKFTHDHEGLDGQSKTCPTSEVLEDYEADGKQTFVFIPEAEQAVAVDDQLSCQGLNRSLGLQKMLNKLYPVINWFILPAPNDSNNPSSQELAFFIRSLMTIEPSIISHGSSFIPTGHHSTESMVIYLNDPVFFDKTVAITWPTADMANLARAVYKDHGGNPDDIPNPVPDNDTIYQITVNRQFATKSLSFRKFHENLDNQPTTCPEKNE